MFNRGTEILNAVNTLSNNFALTDVKIDSINHRVAKNEQLLKSSKDLEDSGYFETDEKGNITWANRYTLNLFGAQREEFAGTSLFSLIEENFKWEMQYDWKHKINAGYTISKEIVMINTNNEHIHVKVSVRAVRNDDNVIIAHVGTIKKIV